MRNNLKVPFAEKDEAKKLGARWDAARKLWYVQGVADLAPFARWSPTPESAAVATPAKPAPAQAAGKLVVGTRYVAQVPACDCPPWEICPVCAPLSLNREAP